MGDVFSPARYVSHVPPVVNSAVTTAPEGRAVLRILRMALHASFGILLVIAVARMSPDDEYFSSVVASAAGLAVVYTVGAWRGEQSFTRRQAQIWLAGITAWWAALLLLWPDFTWLAFPLFFLHLHLLRRTHAIAAVSVITAAVIGVQLWHGGSGAVILGPLLGAVFAIVIAVGYTALYRESEQRRQLIEDLQNTRQELAESQRRWGTLEERERISREIHDTLAQGLSSIVLWLRSAESALPDSPNTASHRVAQARESAIENLAEARQLVRDLRPPALAADNLPDALQRLAQRTATETGLACELRVDGEPVALPADYEVALLRAAQSSLANVRSHANASSAVMSLSFLGTEIALDIVDNGTGFDPQAQREQRDDGTGFGLHALQGRIEALGGVFTIESSPGAGTAVAIRLSLLPQEASS